MLKGYNDMNTNVPNPFATKGSIVLSGAGRMRKNINGNMGVNDFVIREREMNKRLKSKGKKELNEMFGAGMDSDDEMDGAGFFDEVKKGYSKVKKGVKSKTGQKIVSALKEDKDFMKEFNKAKKQLKDYQDGVRKTKPGKAAMDILEKSGVISKIEDEFKGAGNKSGKINRLKNAKKWRDFSEDTAYKGVDLARYGYEKFKEATNPVQAEAKKAAQGIAKMFGGAKRPPSNWVMFVKDFSQKHNIPYKEALSKAGPSYRQLKNKM